MTETYFDCPNPECGKRVLARKSQRLEYKLQYPGQLRSVEQSDFYCAYCSQRFSVFWDTSDGKFVFLHTL